jgi:nicotinamide-nucleotide amidase
MTAEIVAVGTELLLGDIADTNSQALGKVLAEYGIDHLRRATVGDNLERCAQAIREALDRSDIVFTIGGLGPTQDDITAAAIADAVGEPQGFPLSARPIANAYGTAPGIFWQAGGKTVIALPGPRNEFGPMLDGFVREFLSGLGQGVMVSRTFRLARIPELEVERALGPLMRCTNPTIAPYAKTGEVHVRVTAKADTREEANALIEPIEGRIALLFAGHYYGTDEVSAEAATVEMLRRAGKTIATAESCTGGMLAERLTSIPGSSEVFMGGVVTYSNDAKVALLGVPKVDLNKFGAVSPKVAMWMAQGVWRKFGVDFGIGITGIAGPDGGTTEKPVGLVYVGVSTGPTKVIEHHFMGTREGIRQRSVAAALAMIRSKLEA